MEKPKTLDTPENWDAASINYTENVIPVLMNKYVEEFVDRLEVDENMEALEVAAGSGALTLELAKRVKSLLVTDFSPNMLKINEERAKEAGIQNVRYAVMDGQNLDLAEATFDRAACCFGLMLFPERDRGFGEIYRCLKPGGRAMVSGWAGPDKFEGFKLFIDALHTAFPDHPKPPETPPVFTLSDLENFKKEMAAAGFKDVETSYVDRETSLSGFDELWKVLTSGAPPVKALFDSVGPEGAEKIKKALKEIVEERFGDGPIVINNTATVGYGNK